MCLNCQRETANERPHASEHFLVKITNIVSLEKGKLATNLNQVQAGHTALKHCSHFLDSKRK